MNEVKENQSDPHPTQINKVATRSSSKRSFIFQYERYRSLFRFEIRKIVVFVIVVQSKGSKCVVSFRKWVLFIEIASKCPFIVVLNIKINWSLEDQNLECCRNLLLFVFSLAPRCIVVSKVFGKS